MVAYFLDPVPCSNRHEGSSRMSAVEFRLRSTSKIDHFSSLSSWDRKNVENSPSTDEEAKLKSQIIGLLLYSPPLQGLQ